jgi:hypothetical protein
MIEVEGSPPYSVTSGLLEVCLNLDSGITQCAFLVPHYLSVISKFALHNEPVEIAPFCDLFFHMLFAVWSDGSFIPLAREILEALSVLCSKGFSEKLLLEFSFPGLISRFRDDRYTPALGQISSLAMHLIRVDQSLTRFLPVPFLVKTLKAESDWTYGNEIVALLTEVARQGHIALILEGESAESLLCLASEREYHVRETFLSLYWIGFLNLRTIEERIEFINSDVFIIMLFGTHPSDALLPDILRRLAEAKKVADESEDSALSEEILHEIWVFSQEIGDVSKGEIRDLAIIVSDLCGFGEEIETET